MVILRHALRSNIPVIISTLAKLFGSNFSQLHLLERKSWKLAIAYERKGDEVNAKDITV